MEAIVKKWIEKSLFDLFHSNDTELIDRKLKEECINHRLAYYLEKNRPEQFSLYYIDLEYDKKNLVNKYISYKGEKKHIRPDIVIHRRTSSLSDNLIAFECKKNYLNINDKLKLISLLGNEYNYQACIGLSYQPNKPYFLIYEGVNEFQKPIRIMKDLCKL